MMKMTKNKAALTLTAVAASVLVACGGGGSTAPATKSAKMTAALGALNGATCTATEIGSVPARTFAATGTTNASGQATFDGLPLDVGSLIVSCKGGSYYDEATNTTVTLLATDTIKSVLPAGSTETAVTPLTSLVASRVEQALVGKPAGTKVSATEITEAATQIAAVFAPGVDLLAPPKVVTNAADVSAITAADSANKYAAALAGLSKLAKDNAGGDHLALLDTLVADVSDGVIGDDLAADLGLANLSALNTALNQAVSATVSPAVAESTSNRDTTGTVDAPVTTAPTGTGGSGTGGTGGSNT